MVKCLLASNEFDRADGDLAAARIVLGVELHLLAFTKALDAGAFERGGMDEDVLLAIVRLDEAEALLVVVELNGARNHGSILGLADASARERRTCCRTNALGSSMFGRECLNVRLACQGETARLSGQMSIRFI